MWYDNGTVWIKTASVDAAGGSGTVTSVSSANTDIGVATGTSTPVLTLNSGTAANQIVKLDGTAKLPAVDGSALTNLDPTHLSAAVPITKGGTGQITAILGFNALSPITTKGDLITSDGTNNVRLAAGTDGYILQADATQSAGLKGAAAPTGTVTSVVAGSGLTGGTITTTGTIAVDSTTAGVASKILALDASSVATASGVALNGATSGNLLLQTAAATTNYSLTFPGAQGAAGQVLSNDGSGVLSWSSIATGDASYTAKGVVQGLTDAATSGLTIASGVISVNSGTGPNQIVKLDASSKLPAVDGSALANLNATNITSGTLPTAQLPIVPISKGGTNSSTALNNNSIMVSSGGAIVEAAALTNGQLLVGATGAAPVAASLTAGTGVTITPGAGTITIAATGPGGTVASVVPGIGFTGGTSTSTGTIRLGTESTGDNGRSTSG